MMPPKIDFAS